MIVYMIVTLPEGYRLVVEDYVSGETILVHTSRDLNQLLAIIARYANRLEDDNSLESYGRLK